MAPIAIPAGGSLSFVMSIGYAAEGQVVPEPPTIVLFLAGLAGLIGFSARDRAARGA